MALRNSIWHSAINPKLTTSGAFGRCAGLKHKVAGAVPDLLSLGPTFLQANYSKIARRKLSLQAWYASFVHEATNLAILRSWTQGQHIGCHTCEWNPYSFSVWMTRVMIPWNINRLLSKRAFWLESSYQCGRFGDSLRIDHCQPCEFESRMFHYSRNMGRQIHGEQDAFGNCFSHCIHQITPRVVTMALLVFE